MIKIRRYREGEEECLRQLCRDTTLRVNVHEYGKDLVEKWVSSLDNRTDWLDRVRTKNPFVAIVDSEVVGFAELTTKGNISAFYVHHRWQGKGAGGALLDAVSEEAQKLKIETIQVESSVSASNFFVHRGFKKIGEKTTFTEDLPSKSIVLQINRERLTSARKAIN